MTAQRGHRRGPRGRSQQDGQQPDKHSGSEEQSHPCKVFVGGLAHKTTTQHLRDHFGGYGGIVDAVVLRWPDGRSRGFGYVTFANSSAAASVLQEAPHSLSGREVDVKRAVPGTNKLFVGGLPQNTTSNELRDHFEGFGVVSDAVVMIDPATSRSRGFGFVCFLPGQEGAEAVTSSLQQYQNHRIRGKWIEVKSAAPPHKLAAQSKNDAPSQEFSLAGALEGSSRPASSPTPSMGSRESDQSRAHKMGHTTQQAPKLSKLLEPNSDSPMKVVLTSSMDLNAPPPGLAEFDSSKGVPEMPCPWWTAQPWPQPFAPGFVPSFGFPTSEPIGMGMPGLGYPPYAGQMDGQQGLAAVENLQRNLELFLRQSTAPNKMEWGVNKGTSSTPRDPSVSTTCSAATQAEIAQAAALLP